MTRRQLSNNMRSTKKQVAKLSREYWHLHALVYPYSNFSYICWIRVYEGKTCKLRILQDEKRYYKGGVRKLKELLYG